MVKFYDSISDSHAQWALQQSVFFVASAPLAGRHVNLSPKGLPSTSFSVLSPNQVAYVDATGSGSETIAHAYENGRVTVMFCSFGVSPRIMRFFCTGSVVEWDEPEFEPLIKRMGGKRVEGARAVLLLQVWKVQTSCGYGVPRLARQKGPGGVEGEKWEAMFEDRQTMGHWASSKIESNSLHAYQKRWNSDSLDGLTGLKAARRDNGEVLWWTDLQAWLRRMLGQRQAVAFGFALASFLYLVARLLEILVFRYILMLK